MRHHQTPEAQRAREAKLDALLVAHLGAGHGLRQGEIFELSPADIDIENPEVCVVRQVKIRSGNKVLFALPRGRRTRTVPLPDSVLEAINVHMTKFPPRDVTVPWDRLDGAERTVSLLLTTREHAPRRR